MDEILNLIESVSEDFSSYSYNALEDLLNTLTHVMHFPTASFHSKQNRFNKPDVIFKRVRTLLNEMETNINYINV